MRTRVLIAEDNYIIRQGLVMLLEAESGFELVGTAPDFDSLLEQVERLKPDVVVTDVRMPPTHTDEGIRAAVLLRRTSPQVAVVVLSQYAEPEYALALLEGGSAGRAYLLKDEVGDLDQLSDAVRTVVAGGSVIDPKVVERLVASRIPPTDTVLGSLTVRVLDVLRLMAQGKSNAAIARDLFLTDRGVEKHSNSIFSKMGLSEEVDVNKRVKAVLLLLAGAIVQPPASRVLTTVMFADIVGSTRLAAQIGDQQWLKLIDRHDATAQRLVHGHGGRVVKSTGDGMLCTFDLAAEALACAAQLHKAMATMDLSLRIGIHTGEVERRQQDLGGLAVHLCARLCDLAGDGETLLTRTVADVVVGSESNFDDRGHHALRGIPGRWRLLAVRR